MSATAKAPVERDELEAVVRQYNHAHEEHHRAHPGSRVRRHLAVRLDRLNRKFERLLSEAPIDDAERRRWRDHLRHRAPEPSGPLATAAPVFRGRAEAGAELVVIARPDGTLDAVVDGTTIARLDSASELSSTEPGLTFTLDRLAFHERFAASPAALAALRASFEAGGRPAPADVPELLADGIVDRELGLTTRGRRALALDRQPAHRHPGVVPAPSISVRGALPPSARVQLEEMLAKIAEIVPRPLLHLDASLVREDDPALERPVVAKASLDLGLRLVRAHVAAATPSEAIDLLEARLRRNLRELRAREQADRRKGSVAQPGEWRHTGLPPARPSFYDRPAEERQVVRRKSFTPGPITPEEATWEMQLLDHDFHLFTDAASDEDAVVYLRPDGVLGLKRVGGDGGFVDPFRLDPDPAPTLSLEAAIQRLNVTNEPFLFFLADDSGRGSVLYRRHDGHYGLITPPALGD